jgi:hypothetical protein
MHNRATTDSATVLGLREPGGSGVQAPAGGTDGLARHTGSLKVEDGVAAMLAHHPGGTAARGPQSRISGDHSPPERLKCGAPSVKRLPSMTPGTRGRMESAS